MVIKIGVGLSLAQRKLNSEVCDLREKSGEVYEEKFSEVSEYTKILRWISNYKGNHDFLRDMKRKVRKYGMKNMSDKQKEGITNCYHSNQKGQKGQNLEDKKEKRLIKSFIETNKKLGKR